MSCFTSNFSCSGEEFCFTHHEFESNTTFSRRVTKSCKSQLACQNEPLGCETDPLTGMTVSTLKEIEKITWSPLFNTFDTKWDEKYSRWY